MKTQSSNTANTKKIIVVESGWVFLADVAEQESWLHLTDCSVIRAWGTTKGLGEIALSGPTSSTVLDPCGEAFVPRSKVLFVLPCIY